jgi:hypothetical protein
MLFFVRPPPYPADMEWTLGIRFQPAPARDRETLATGQLLRLTRARGRRVTCERGCVWITAPGEPDDVYLLPGQTWTIPANGLVLVEAEDDAIVALDC